MNETTESLKRPLRTPFWVGYAVSFAALFIFLAAIHALNRGLDLVLFLCVAVGMIAPAGGLFFQAIHDLVSAKREHQLRVWDILLLIAIVASFGMAIYFRLRIKGNSPIWVAGAFVYVLIWIYSRRRRS